MKKMLISTVILFFTVLLVSCKEKTYEVTFDTDGGTEVTSIFVKDGQVIDLPQVKKEGHYLLGWYSDSYHSMPFQNRITKNQTVYAKWQILSYELTYEGLDRAFNYNHLYQSEVSNPPIRTFNESVIYGFYYDQTFLDEVNYPIFMPANDLTIYAKVSDKISLIESLANKIFENDRLFASMRIAPSHDSQTPYMHIFYEQTNDNYLIHTNGFDTTSIDHISKDDDKNYHYGFNINDCVITPYDPSVIFDSHYYKKASTIKKIISDMSFFELDTYRYKLKENHLLDISNLYFEKDDQIPMIRDFYVNIGFNLYSKHYIDISFYDLYLDATIEFFFSDFDTHQINASSSTNCIIDSKN